MSDAVKVEMIGLDQFKAQLERLSDAVNAEMLANAVTSGLLLIQNVAKQKAPKRTGNLSRSIHTEVLEKRRNFAEAAVGTDVVYAAIQEFGGVITPKTAKMLHWVDRETGEDRFAHSVTIQAHPYLRPAWDENIDAAKQEVADALAAQLLATL